MALLKDIAESKVAGIAPTPVEAYAISTYLINDGLFNLMQFAPVALGTGNGNFAASYVQYNDEEGVDVAFRGLGEEYTAANATPEPKTVYLKALGGAYEVDRITERALKNGGINVWKEQQARQKANRIKNSFAKYFISGDTTVTPKGFNGVYKEVFANHADLEDTTPFDLSAGLSFDNAFGLEQHFRKAISKMNVKPNCLITTRDGSAIAGTLNSIRQLGVGAAEIRDVKYDQCMGMPIVVVDDSYFPVAKTAIGIPFLFVYIADDEKGIKAGIPMDGTVLDIVEPEFGTGTFVKNAGMEMLTAPLFENPRAAAVCYVDVTPAEG